MESIPNEKSVESTSFAPQIIIFFINGMLTGPREASLDALELGEFLGIRIRTIYNPTHGIIRDLLKSLWLYLGGKCSIASLTRKEIEEALASGPVTVVTIAHSQGALVISNAINLFLATQRARMGVVALASPIVIDPSIGLLFIEYLAASRDLIPKIARFRRRRHQEPDIIILESSKGTRFEHRFLGGTYQKSGWPRLKEIIEELKQSLIAAMSKKDSNKQ